MDAPTPPPRAGLTTMRKVALGGGVLGVAAAGAGLYFGLDARSKEADADALCPQTACSGSDGEAAVLLNDEAQTSARRANVLYIGAGVVVAASVALWVLGAPASPSPRGVAVAPVLTSTTTGLALGGWF